MADCARELHRARLSGRRRSPIALRVISGKTWTWTRSCWRPGCAAPGSGAGRSFPAPMHSGWRTARRTSCPATSSTSYGGVAAVQHLAEWTEARREQLRGWLVELTGVRAVVARDDGSAREFEHLPRRVDALFGSGLSRPATTRGRRARSGSAGRSQDRRVPRPGGEHLRAGELARGEALARSATTAAFPCSWRGRRTR